MVRQPWRQSRDPGLSQAAPPELELLERGGVLQCPRQLPARLGAEDVLRKVYRGQAAGGPLERRGEERGGVGAEAAAAKV